MSDKRGNRSALTTTDVEDTSRDSPDSQKGRLWPSREDTEQGVDDIFLPHKDGNKKVRDNGVSDLSGIRLMCRSEAYEDRHIGREGYAEKASIY